IAIIGVSLNYNSIFKDTSTNPEPQKSPTTNPEPQKSPTTNPEPQNSPTTNPTQPSSSNPREIKRPLSTVSTTARWYTYDSNGVNVRYFFAKGSDGEIHLGTDACYNCYDKNIGYRQNGDEMVCNKCGQTFSINSIGIENRGDEGCWPSYIPFSINEDNIIIRMSDLDAKRPFFA
ncbi:MAG: Fe-S-containing protein, partial [Candidatus Bathyarchaeia archaeon]